MNNAEMLKRAFDLATEAHHDQVDKAGEPYINHVLRVANAVKTEEERIVALLHDVVEDCGITFADLEAQGFRKDIIAGIDSVTRRTDETYEDFVLRAAVNTIGRHVKLADLRDNANLHRLSSPAPADYARAEKYHRAIAVLESMV